MRCVLIIPILTGESGRVGESGWIDLVVETVWEAVLTSRLKEKDFDTSHERVKRYGKPASSSGKPAVDL